MISKERVRFAQAAFLTTTTVALIAALVATMGTTALLVSVITLPVPLVLLWLSADVLRSDERESNPRTARTQRPIALRNARQDEEANMRASA